MFISPLFESGLLAIGIDPACSPPLRPLDNPQPVRDPHTPAAQRKLMSKGLCLGLSIPLAFLGPLIVIIGATC